VGKPGFNEVAFQESNGLEIDFSVLEGLSVVSRDGSGSAMTFSQNQRLARKE
jgi:hypothetical protein